MRIRTIRPAGPALALFLLAGCAGLSIADQPVDHSAVEREWDAANERYEDVLTAAVEYHDDCLRRDTFLDTCYPVIEELRRVNREAQETRQIAGMAIESKDDDLLSEATENLDGLRQKLRTVILSQE